jgi:hypothetical protein
MLMSNFLFQDEVYRFLEIRSDIITANRGVSRCIRYFILFVTGVTKVIMYVQVKGKAITLEAWTSPEGSRRLRLPVIRIIGT